MKRLTRILGATMSASLMLGLTPQMAVAGNITVNSAAVDSATDTNSAAETYTAYKIFDAVKSATGTGVTYKIASDDPWFGVLFDASGATVVPVAQNTWFTLTAIPGESTASRGVYQVNPTSAFTDTTAHACADWLMEHKPAGATGQVLAEGANTVADGYYLVSSTRGSNLGLATSDISDMNIIEKNTYPTIDKTQKDADATDGLYTNDPVGVRVGDTVDYQVVVNVPATVNQDITITDVMSVGLTPAEASAVAIAAGTYDNATSVFTPNAGSALVANTDWGVSATETGYVVTLHPTDNIKGKTIQLTFSATVDSDAIVDEAKNNTATLVYSAYTQSDMVEYDTYATGMAKYDGENNADLLPDATTNELPAGTTYLANAEFQLLDADGTTVIPVSYDADGGYYYPDANGTSTITSNDTANGIVIRGLDNKTYYLKETKAPAGYNLLTTNVSLVVAVEDGSLADLAHTNIVKIKNNSGSAMPTTGGIGTVIFYTVGGALVIGGAIFLIMKANKQNK